METKTITTQITDQIFEILEKHPEGVAWTDLNRAVQESNSTFHPKTINGTVWRLIEKYPEKVYKPEKGVFRLLKYKE